MGLTRTGDFFDGAPCGGLVFGNAHNPQPCIFAETVSAVAMLADAAAAMMMGNDNITHWGVTSWVFWGEFGYHGSIFSGMPHLTRLCFGESHMRTRRMHAVKFEGNRGSLVCHSKNKGQRALIDNLTKRRVCCPAMAIVGARVRAQCVCSWRW